MALDVSLFLHGINVNAVVAVAPVDTTQRVLMGTSLVKLDDLNPFIRNDNSASSAVEIKTGPQALINLSATSKLMLFEGVQNTGYPANNGMTASMRATATSWQGPWTVTPATRVFDAAAGAPENYELSPANALWDATNNRFIINGHMGNNTGPRQGAVFFSTDGQTCQAFARYGSNPTIPNGATGAFDDKQAGGDLKAVWEPQLSLYVGFYRAQKTGGALTDGTVGRVTSPDFISWTKTGQVISAAPSWNATGVTSGQPFRDAGARYHMFAPGGPSGIGYYYSDDYGVTWTVGNSGNRVAQPSGTAGAYDQFSTGDVVQGVVDGDVIFLTFGTENISTYPTNNPMRGASMAVTPWPKVTPTRIGKWFLDNANTTATFTGLLTQTVFTATGAFRLFRSKRTSYKFIHHEYAAFNKEFNLTVDSSGKLHVFYRTPSAIVDIATTATVDDALKHTYVFRRLSTNSFEFYFDDVLVGSSSNNPATDATATTRLVGNSVPASGGGDTPFKGCLSDTGVITGAAWTTAECAAWRSSRTLGAGGTVVFDLATNGTTGESGNVIKVEAA